MERSKHPWLGPLFTISVAVLLVVSAPSVTDWLALHVGMSLAPAGPELSPGKSDTSRITVGRVEGDRQVPELPGETAEGIRDIE